VAKLFHPIALIARFLLDAALYEKAPQRIT